MKNTTYLNLILLTALICNSASYTSLSAQIMEDGDYLSAIKMHTRNKEGTPGEKYWQNSAHYNLNVSITGKNTITGRGVVTYFNNSPDTLYIIRFKLYQNLHRITTLRATSVDSAYLTSGMHITQLEDSDNNVDYLQKTARITYLHDGTDMDIKLATPLYPHDTLELNMAWNYALNNSKTTAPRESIIDSTTAFVAYWYPRIAVYDDVQGWDESIQNETSEFYNDFCSYDVHVTMPVSYSVYATGSLLDKKRKQDSTIWHYTATGITDFAWATSDHYVSDTLFTDIKGNKKTVITAYQSRKQYPKTADIAKRCVQFYSTVLPGIEFPFNTLTLFEGRSQMEYPMLINDNDEAVYTDMVTLTAHEISHMYFPFMMGINETRYAWMDEGWATFHEYHFMNDEFKSESGVNTFLSFYHRLIKQVDPAVSSIPLMAPSDMLVAGAYTANSYTKGWLMYETIKNVLGDSLFKKTLIAYMQAWRGKHPTPYDFFSFFKNYSKEDINWVFNAYAFHFGTFDLAIDQVKEKEGTLEVLVKNEGGLPMPFTVEVTLKSGTLAPVYLPAKTWQHTREVLVKIKTPKNKTPVSVHVNTDIYPDVMPANNDYYIIAQGKKGHHHKQRN